MSASSSGTFRLGGDLEVNRLGFGAMRVTGAGVWGPPPDQDTAIRLLRRAVELGVNLIDTADSYGPEVSEQLIAEALHPYPKGLVIATKGGLTRPGPDVWERNGRPEHLARALDGSLARLKLERIDVYQLHAVDPQVPLEESLGALVDGQRAGKIRHIGVSNFDVDQLARARKVAQIVSVQNRYNLDDRHSEAVLDVCEQEGIGFLPWAPIKAGNDTLAKVAARHGVSTTQVSLAWLLRRSKVMLPIPGTSSVKHLEQNMEAAKLELTDDELRELG